MKEARTAKDASPRDVEGRWHALIWEADAYLGSHKSWFNKRRVGGHSQRTRGNKNPGWSVSPYRRPQPRCEERGVRAAHATSRNSGGAKIPRRRSGSGPSSTHSARRRGMVSAAFTRHTSEEDSGTSAVHVGAL